MIDYKGFIRDHFLIKNKEGQIVPFIFNETQDYYYSLLLKEYADLQGIRENILKFRQPGFSSLIDAIFATDFILSGEGKIPVITGQIISHKTEETLVLFRRVDFFLNCYLRKAGKTRKQFLRTDTTHYLETYAMSELFIGTAGAKTLGRGGTLQNIHWSEIAFYSNTDVLNAEDLVTSAEQQVADKVGKIFRESTGNLSGDYFDTEYQKGLNPNSSFKSRFLSWWLHRAYATEVPEDWQAPEYYQQIISDHNVSLGQCYWHWLKTEKLENKKKLREYPTYPEEAFLYGGETYFSKEALEYYTNQIKKPIYTGDDLVRSYGTI